jgi:hypothetical protein|tara:strand:+ start:707 stop:877 length:171 start_codon:yes stop_codon:yes gene_type:complete
MVIVEWIMDRMKEPSSYAAAGGAIIGLGIIFSQPLLIWAGIAGGGIGFILKEKNII